MFSHLATDVSNSVRRLAHVVHEQICTLAGKRVAKAMPTLCGPWISGLFEPDRAVARAAVSSFEHIFASPEKQIGVMKAYQQSLLEYVRDIVLYESGESLSKCLSKYDNILKNGQTI